MEPKKKTIGVVGGVGPYAGLDLVKKIFDHTIAAGDHDHMDVILVSSSEVPDRSAFLLDPTKENPAGRIVEILKQLEDMGAEVAGIPCNTAHAEQIMKPVLAGMKQGGSTLKLIDMIDETIRFLQGKDYARIGVLATTGTVKARLYSNALRNAGFECLEPSENVQNTIVHEAIYNREKGIKSHSDPVTTWAVKLLRDAAEHLIKKGVDVILLACTEIPLALRENSLNGVPLLDATAILARALIRESAPGKLKQLPGDK